MSVEQPFQKMDKHCLLWSFQHGRMFWFLKFLKLFKVLMNFVTSSFGDCSVSMYVNNYEIAQKMEINRLYAPSDFSLLPRHEGFPSPLPGVLTRFTPEMDHCHPPLFHSRRLSTDSRFILLSWMEPQTGFLLWHTSLQPWARGLWLFLPPNFSIILLLTWLHQSLPD